MVVRIKNLLSLTLLILLIAPVFAVEVTPATPQQINPQPNPQPNTPQVACLTLAQFQEGYVKGVNHTDETIKESGSTYLLYTLIGMLFLAGIGSSIYFYFISRRRVLAPANPLIAKHTNELEAKVKQLTGTIDSMTQTIDTLQKNISEKEETLTKIRSTFFPQEPEKVKS